MNDLPENIRRAMLRQPVFAPYAPPIAKNAPSARPEPEKAEPSTAAQIYAHDQIDAQISHAKPQQRPEKLVCGGEGKAQSPGRIALRFTLRRVRLLDPCAKYGSCKALIDGLRYAGILHNDREEDITLEVHQEKVAHFKNEETEIVITIP